MRGHCRYGNHRGMIDPVDAHINAHAPAAANASCYTEDLSGMTRFAVACAAGFLLALSGLSSNALATGHGPDDIDPLRQKGEASELSGLAGEMEQSEKHEMTLICNFLLTHPTGFREADLQACRVLRIEGGME